MRRKKVAGRYSQKVVNAVILAVILLLLVYFGIQISRSFSSKVSTQRTQITTESAYVYLDGCIFRDDTVAKDSGSIIYYTVQNGDKVGVGQVYTKIFTPVGVSPDECEIISKRLSELSAAISLLEEGVGISGSSSHLGSVNDAIVSGYYSYIDSILNGDLNSADDAGSRLLSGLVDYSAITAGDAARDRLSILKSERDNIIASLGDSGRELTSEQSFNFFYRTDGYEDLMHSSRLDGMTAADLDQIMSSEAVPYEGAIGKMTVSSKWYLAIPIDMATYGTFEPLVGSTLTVDYLNSDGLEIDMLLEGVFSDGEDGGAYILMSSHSLAHIASLDRFQSVGILLDTCTGYRVPTEALRRQNGQDGVYILVGNVIEFRRVSVLSPGKDYCIVASHEADLEGGNDSETPYLNINDMIVTSGNDLYDGKQLD